MEYFLRQKGWIILGLLFALFVVASGYKVNRAFQNPLIIQKSDFGSFWTENAIHYRWAKMVAEGEGIPKWDQRVQYPEGMNPFTEETPIMG